jgi:hypothetical protein
MAGRKSRSTRDEPEFTTLTSSFPIEEARGGDR